ncbi:hypothetical protein MMPV_006764 [Pyropia vietnamensis]
MKYSYCQVDVAAQFTGRASTLPKCPSGTQSSRPAAPLSEASTTAAAAAGSDGAAIVSDRDGDRGGDGNG